MKVPLALAALEAGGPRTDAHATRALRMSDNEAAAALWSGLGAPLEAGAAVDDALRRRAVRDTRTEVRRTRPQFSAFGQTRWGLVSQVDFLVALHCRATAGVQPDARVRDLMAGVIPSQRWGVGRVAGSSLKGGWGPDPQGAYTVRQMALVPVNGSTVAVSMAAKPSDGTMASGVGMLDQLAAWFDRTVTAPRGISCPS